MMGLAHWDIGPIFDFLSWLHKENYQIYLKDDDAERLALPRVWSFFIDLDFSFVKGVGWYPGHMLKATREIRAAQTC